MLRLSNETDYALVLLSRIARDGAGELSSARDLADHTGLPQPVVGKVLKALARSGLLESRRGVNGGYRLVRAADDLRVTDVIEAIEGPLAVTWCGTDELARRCAHETNCPSRGPMARLTDVVRDALADVRLTDLVSPPGEGASPARIEST